MFQTLIVYISLTITMLLLSMIPMLKYKNDLQYSFFSFQNFPVLLALLIYSAIFGMRYGVGVDHLTYLDDYLKTSSYADYYDRRMEWGFVGITLLFSKLGLHFSFYFAFLAFFQLFWIFYAFRDWKELYPFIVFTFMVGCSWIGYCNGIRQWMAFSLFVYSLDFIVRRKFLSYCLIIIVASFFHKSVLMLLIIYPFFAFKIGYFRNMGVQYIIYFSALGYLFLFGSTHFESIMKFFGGILGDLAYSGYTSAHGDRFFNLSRERGIGFWLLVLLDLVIIWNRKLAVENLDRKYKKYFSLLYDLYFIGAVFKLLFNGSIFLLRPVIYFSGYKVLLVSVILLVVFKKKLYLRIFLFIFIYFLLFAANMYRMEENTAKYVFFWQEQLVIEKDANRKIKD